MKGLVMVKLKKDCLELPAKVYKRIYVEVEKDVLRAAKLIQKTTIRAVEVLMRLRELSDGFQYNEVKGPTEVCGFCHGAKVFDKGENGLVPCDVCCGKGTKDTYHTETTRVACAKDDALIDILDEMDNGRLVVYGGFTETINRIADVCGEQKWTVIRVDGRGCHSKFGDLEKSITAFQDKEKYPENIVFVGHPEAAGMGITLTAAHTIVYYSNTFRAEDRIQSEDRIHRMGMGDSATIIDLIGLKTDEFVLENLQKKRELQSITLGEILEAAIEGVGDESR
jgi:SNF2 family DNA or RNA helicase